MGNSTDLTTLGSAPGGSTFDGVTTTTADVLVKYTDYGDASLDGTIDGADYSRIDSARLTGATGWYERGF